MNTPADGINSQNEMFSGKVSQYLSIGCVVAFRCKVFAAVSGDGERFQFAQVKNINVKVGNNYFRTIHWRNTIQNRQTLNSMNDLVG